MAEPNTAEEILHNNLPFGKNTYMGECKREVLESMHDHTAQTLDRLKEMVDNLEDEGRDVYEMTEDVVRREDVLKLIEEVSDG